LLYKIATTIGLTGIHSMFVAQRKRFFPLPDYTRSTDRQVVLEVYGHAIDLNYTRLLLQRQDLDLGTVVLLDRVQKKYPIPDETAAGLRRVGLV
jgi:ATP-dependent DNA helicase RecG